MTYSVDRAGEPLHPFPGFTGYVFQLRPESRGYIDTLSGDPYDRPLIKPNYLSASNDRSTLLRGIKLLRKVMTSGALARYVGHEHDPGEQVQKDTELLEFLRAKGHTVYHPCGTCAMGPEGAGVVDSELRVAGVGGLRVVDASVIPSIVSGNINAATMMIAEKAADHILAGASL